MRKKDVVKSINMTNDLCKAECSKSNNCQSCHFNKKNKSCICYNTNPELLLDRDFNS